MNHHWRLLGLITLAVTPLLAQAHTLPISYITMVQDQEYVHLELTLNPFELRFFSELDTSGDKQISRAELEAKEQDITAQVLRRLKVIQKDRVLVSETAGIASFDDTHHIKLRAHYRVSGDGPVSLESNLPEITSSSHFTQITYGRADAKQLAQCDARNRTASFANPGAQIDDRSGLQPTPPENRRVARLFRSLILFAAISALALVAGITFGMKRFRDEDFSTVRHRSSL